MLTWIAVQSEHQRIEADLAHRAQEALDKAGLRWSVASFSGRDGSLVGRPAEEGERAKALDVVANVWGVGSVDGRVDATGAVENYTWAIRLNDEGIKLFGFVPNEEIRKTIYGVLTVSLPKRAIDDRMKVARGAPPLDTWLGGTSFAIKQLALLKRGTANLDETNLIIAGEALDTASYKSVKSAFANNLPTGIKLVGDRVSAPAISPYRWSAKLAGNQLVLQGYGPSEALREDVFVYAKKVFPRRAIVDRMETGEGAPADWGKAVMAGLDQLARLNEGDLDLRGSRLGLSGKAADETTATTAGAAFTGTVPANFSTSTDISFPKSELPTARPFVTSVGATAEAVELEGSVPDEGARKTIIDAAKSRFRGRSVTDRMQLAAGAPEGWQTCVVAAITSLARLSSGRASLMDRRLELSGRVADEAIANALPGELRAAANRDCDAYARVEVDAPAEPNLTFRVRSSGQGEVVLEGKVPDEGIRNQLVEAVNRQFPGARLVDRAEVAAQPSGKWGSAAELGIRQLAKLRKGEATLAGLVLDVRGEAADAAAVTSVRDALARELAKGFRGSDAIEVRSDAMIWAEQEAQRKAELQRRTEDAEAARKAQEAEAARKAAEAKRAGEEAARAKAAEDEKRRLKEDEDARRRAEAAKPKGKAEVAAVSEKQRQEADDCQKAMGAIASEGGIQFDFASASLREASLPTLDRLVRVAGACPQARIEIRGHTDSDGEAARNERLSLRRAQAVVDYLNRSGVSSERMSAAGFGASRPLVANDSEANKAKNRRIEFIVKAN